MITRRRVLLALGAGSVSVSLPALGQQERGVRRIGYISGQNVKNNAAYLAAFRDGMSELRWVEGRDYAIDARYANGVAQVLPDMATALVATRPDVLLTTGGAVVRLLAQRTKTIPIVFGIDQDPLGNELVASLQRPGGNVTGLATLARDLGAKRLQLLKEAFPRIVRVVVLFEPDNVVSLSQAKEIEAAAVRLGMRATPIELRQAADIEPAFRRGAALGAHAYTVAQGFFVGSQRQAITDGVLRAKVPGIFYGSAFVEAGGLMSYGPTYSDNFRRAAAYVDKILKGAKPGELPIQQPTQFELVLNMKAAKATGLTFPQSFLARADRVIE